MPVSGTKSAVWLAAAMMFSQRCTCSTAGPALPSANAPAGHTPPGLGLAPAGLAASSRSAASRSTVQSAAVTMPVSVKPKYRWALRTAVSSAGSKVLVGVSVLGRSISGIHWPRNSSIRLSRSTSAPLSPGRSAAAGAGNWIMRTTGPLLSSAAAASYRLCHVSRPTTPSTGSPARACHALTARAVAAPKRPSTVTDGISL